MSVRFVPAVLSPCSPPGVRRTAWRRSRAPRRRAATICAVLTARRPASRSRGDVRPKTAATAAARRRRGARPSARPWPCRIGRRQAEPDAGIDAIAVVTWNVHVGGGDIVGFVQALRAGRFTNGVPVPEMILLVQETFRSSRDVPDPRAARRGGPRRDPGGAAPGAASRHRSGGGAARDDAGLRAVDAQRRDRAGRRRAGGSRQCGAGDAAAHRSCGHRAAVRAAAARGGRGQCERDDDSRHAVDGPGGECASRRVRQRSPIVDVLERRARHASARARRRARRRARPSWSEATSTRGPTARSSARRGCSPARSTTHPRSSCSRPSGRCSSTISSSACPTPGAPSHAASTRRSGRIIGRCWGGYISKAKRRSQDVGAGFEPARQGVGLAAPSESCLRGAAALRERRARVSS